MLRKTNVKLWFLSSAVLHQGWGGSAGGGGWGDSGGSSSGGGWGSAGASKSSGWGSASSGDSGKSRWGDSSSDRSGGGWGGGDQQRKSSGWGEQQQAGNAWTQGDAGWKGAPTGDRASRGGSRGNFRRGRGFGQGGSHGGGGVWGEPAKVDEEAWAAAPPSFTPPVRRVDPLTLTAVEVEIDGVKKLVGQRVQLSGLSDETTWQTLKDHLRQASEVTFCKIFSNGRAMVEFSTPEDAARAITELQGSELEGATIFLREDREDTVLVNTRRKIREARDAQLRARKQEAEKARQEAAVSQGDRPTPTTS